MRSLFLATLFCAVVIGISETPLTDFLDSDRGEGLLLQSTDGPPASEDVEGATRKASRESAPSVEARQDKAVSSRFAIAEPDAARYGVFDTAVPPYPGVEFRSPALGSHHESPTSDYFVTTSETATQTYPKSRFTAPDNSLGDAHEVGLVENQSHPYGHLLEAPSASAPATSLSTANSDASASEIYANALFSRPRAEDAQAAHAIAE